MKCTEGFFKTEAEQAAMVGTMALTLKDAGGKNWSDETRSGCRWGVIGQVINYSNSHGLCFRVRHGDDTDAWYDPEELKFLNIEEITNMVVICEGCGGKAECEGTNGEFATFQCQSCGLSETGHLSDFEPSR